MFLTQRWKEQLERKGRRIFVHCVRRKKEN
jgi:hypothetical protein